MNSESTRPVEPIAPPLTPTPVYVTPLPRVRVLRLPRSCVLAATVVSHGLLCATLPGPLVSPELPAEAATKTPAAAALRNAISVGSTTYWLEPEIEKLITS